MKIIQRHLHSRILEARQAFPVVYINGPRQAGKTTLVQQFAKAKSHFITFDDVLERAAAKRNPLNYLKQSGNPLTLDEVQLVPELFRPLKILVDEQRYQALTSDAEPPNGNYLMTGSANLLAIPELADAMVGRMATLTLLPLSMSEVKENAPSSFLARCFAKDFSGIETKKNLSLTQAIRQASFPELRNMPDDMLATWFRNYVEKVTLEDPRHIYNLEKAEYMPMLLQVLAARAGSLVNDANIAAEIGLNAVTTRHYRGLLNNTFVTYHLNPWYRNISKRLVKSSKIYFYDTLLLCHLLGCNLQSLEKQHPQRFGHLLENFVLSELLKNNYATSGSVAISFYRTNDGREIDFILEKNRQLVAIEVKNAENITERDLSGIKELQQAVGKDFYCGIVLCNTPRVIAFDDNIYLLPFSALWH